MKRRIFATVVCLIMVLALLPTTAFAAEATQSADFITDPDAALELLNAAKTGTEDSTWNSVEKILTLNGVDFSTSVSDTMSESVAALIIPSGTTIKLGAGSINTIRATGSGVSALYCPTDGDNIVIYGAGTISFIGAPDSTEGFGSSGRGVNLSIGGGAVVNMTGGYDAIYLNGDDETVLGIEELTITGSTTYNDFTNLAPAGFDPEWPGSAYMGEGGSGSDSALSLRIAHSVVQIWGQKLTQDAPYYHNGVNGAQGTVNNVEAGANAIYDATEGMVTLDGLTVTGSTAISNKYDEPTYYGIHVGDNFTVKLTGTSTVTVADGAHDSAALWCSRNMSILGNGSLTATAGDSTEGYSYGVLANAIIMSAAELNGVGGDVSADNVRTMGVAAIEGIRLTGGALSGVGGAATGENGYTAGVYAVASVGGGVLTAIANDNAASKYAIYPRLILGEGVTAQGSTSISGANPVTYNATDNNTYLWVRASDGSDSAPTVTMVAVNPASVSVQKGGTQPFNATVMGANEPAQTVTWSVDGGVAGTTIDEDGVLTVDADETATMLTVTATSTVDTNESGTATVTVTAPAAYEIIRGANGRWTRGSVNGLGFTANGEFEDFTGVSVDGETLSNDNYIAGSGSTVITLKAAYLETLTADRHTIRVIFADGYAETNFTVNAAVPPTGDSANPALWLTIALAALSAGFVMFRRRQITVGN